MKRIILLFAVLIGAAGLTACTKDNTNTFDAADQDETEKLHGDISGENIRRVNIDGNARSVVIRQGEDEFFEFINGDLNDSHTYEVLCDENDGTMDIRIMMENAEEDHDVLGSVIVSVPQMEFEMIEVHGGFGQISLDTLNSDVWIHANDSFVYLDLEADRLEHDITLEGSGSDVFRGVSVYLDEFPDNVKMEFHLLEGGTINDPQNILENGQESGAGKPVLSISHTKEINIYKKE